MRRLLIVFHTQSGSTERLAHAAAEGVRRENNVELRLLRAMEAGSGDLRWCEAVLFATPENFGYMSGGMKDFLDRTFYAVLPEQLNRAYAVLVSAGNDGEGALRQMRRILGGYPMREVAEALVVRGAPDTVALARATELGHALAAGLDLGIF